VPQFCIRPGLQMGRQLQGRFHAACAHTQTVQLSCARSAPLDCKGQQQTLHSPASTAPYSLLHSWPGTRRTFTTWGGRGCHEDATSHVCLVLCSKCSSGSMCHTAWGCVRWWTRNHHVLGSTASTWRVDLGSCAGSLCLEARELPVHPWETSIPPPDKTIRLVLTHSPCFCHFIQWWP